MLNNSIHKIWDDAILKLGIRVNKVKFQSKRCILILTTYLEYFQKKAPLKVRRAFDI